MASDRRVSGPYPTSSAQNSWPMTTSRSRSMTKAFPARREVSTKRSACLRACRSEPPGPHEHLAGPGRGLGDIGDGKLLVSHDHGAHGSPLLLEAGFPPPRRRLGRVASEAGGLDALDGAILVAVGRVAADPDRADGTALA